MMKELRVSFFLARLFGVVFFLMVSNAFGFSLKSKKAALLKECKKGKANACFQVASMFAEKMETVHDGDVYFYLKKSCFRGYARACTLLAVWHLQQGGSCQKIKLYLFNGCHEKDVVACLWLLYLKEIKIEPSFKSLFCFSMVPKKTLYQTVCQSKETLKALKFLSRFHLIFFSSLKKFLTKSFTPSAEFISSLSQRKICNSSYERKMWIFLFTRLSKKILSTWMNGVIFDFIKRKNNANGKNLKSLMQEEFFTLIFSDRKICGLGNTLGRDFEYSIR